jgi:hypothetical protein
MVGSSEIVCTRTMIAKSNAKEEISFITNRPGRAEGVLAVRVRK